MKSIGQWMISAAAAISFSACTPKATTAPPPQTPVAADSSDGGFPNVPLTRKGVVVPSDVKLQPGPTETPPSGDKAVGAAFKPPGN